MSFKAELNCTQFIPVRCGLTLALSIQRGVDSSCDIEMVRDEKLVSFAHWDAIEIKEPFRYHESLSMRLRRQGRLSSPPKL